MTQMPNDIPAPVGAAPLRQRFRPGDIVTGPRLGLAQVNFDDRRPFASCQHARHGERPVEAEGGRREASTSSTTRRCAAPVELSARNPAPPATTPGAALTNGLRQRLACRMRSCRVAPSGMPHMVDLRYYYEVVSPNRYSAKVQILKTGRAAAETGCGFTFATGPISEAAGLPLEALGVAPHPRLRIEQAFPALSRPAIARSLAVWARMALRRAPRGEVALSRGETGMPVAPTLRQKNN